MNSLLRYLLGVFIVVNAIPASGQIKQVHIGVIPAGDSIIFKKRTKINASIHAPAIVKNQFKLLKQEGADTLKSDDPKTALLNDSTATHVYQFPRIYLTDTIIHLKEQSTASISAMSIDTGLTLTYSFTLKKVGFVFIEGYIPNQDTLLFKPAKEIADQYEYKMVADTFFLLPKLPAQQLTKTQWEKAVRSIYFGNKSSRPDTSVRKLSIWIEDSVLRSEETILNIKLQAVNNLPTIIGDTTSLIYKEPVDALLVPTYSTIDSLLQITDPDSDTLKHVQIIIENYHKGEDSLLILNHIPNDKIELHFDNLKGELNIRTTNILSDAAYWTQLLRKLSYVNFSDLPDTTQRTISIRMIDGSDTSMHYKRRIVIKPSNDSPLIKGSIEAAHFIESKQHTSAGAIIVDSLITISDKDDLVMTNATVQMQNFRIAQDTLYIAERNGISDSVEIRFDTFGKLKITARYGYVSKERLQNLLQKLTYQNNSKWPDTSVRTLMYQTSDGKDSSSFFIKKIIISPVNNEPVILGATDTLLLTVKPKGQDAVVILDTTVDIQDHDDSLLTSATIAIVNFKKEQDSLFLSGSLPTDGIIVHFDGAIGLLKISSVGGGISIHKMRNVLRSVTYTNTSSIPDTTQRIFQLQVKDFSANSNPIRYYMSVRVLNSAPRFVKREYANIKICSGEGIRLDTMLRVYDTDTEQKLTFQILQAKGEMNGMSDVLQTNGGIVHPSSVNYLSPLNFKGTDTLTIRVTDTFFESDTVKIILLVNNIPQKENATIQGDSIICANAETSSIYTLVHTLHGDISWHFSGSGVLVSETGKTVVLTFDNDSKPGMLKATLRNECGISEPVEKYVHIRYPGNISHKMTTRRDTVCVGEKNIVYAVDEMKGYSYYWYSDSKDFILRPDHNKLLIDVGKNTGKGIIAVVITDSCGNHDTITHAININKPPDEVGKITAGKSSICSSDTVSFQVSANTSVVYNWSYSGSNVLLTDSLHKVSLSFNEYSTDGELSVTANNFCGTTKPSFFSVEIHKKPVQPLSRTTEIAVDAGQQNFMYEILNWVDECEYVWTYTGTGLRIVKQRPYFFLSFSDTAQSGTLKLVAQNGCYATPALPIDVQVTNPRVQLHYFGVQLSGKDVLGNIRISNEYMIQKYEVYHSTDNAVYRKIADIEAGQKLSVHYNTDNIDVVQLTDEGLSYSFLHQEPVPGDNYYKLMFRSKNGVQYNLDKQFIYIDTTVKMNRLVLYPNPFYHTLNIVCKNIPPDDYLLKLYDLNGIILFSKRMNIKSTDRIKEVVFNTFLAKGSYHLVLESAKNRFGSIIMKQ